MIHDIFTSENPHKQLSFYLASLGYQLNKRYTYHYEGIIAHGIPEALDNDLALRFTTTTHLDYLPSNYIIMRVGLISLGIHRLYIC